MLAVRDNTGRRRYKNFNIWEAEKGKKKKEKINSTSVYINDTIFVDTGWVFNLHRLKA